MKQSLSETVRVEDEKRCSTCSHILDCYTKYHRIILDTMSIQTQDPRHVYAIEAKLREAGQFIRTYIDSGRNRSRHDPTLSEFFNCLGDLDTWDSHCKTCAKYWTTTFFDEASLTISPTHIERIKKSIHRREDE
jgi:hypothetical protein